MLVREIMVKSVLTATENTTLAEIAQVMVEQSIGCVPIVNDAGKLTGLVTKSDLTCKDGGIPFLTFRSPHLFGCWLPSDGVEKMYAAAEERLAKEIMTRDVVTVTEYDSIQVVLKQTPSCGSGRSPSGNRYQTGSFASD